MEGVWIFLGLKSDYWFNFKLTCFSNRYGDDIAKVQKQYNSEPFKFLEPRFAEMIRMIFFEQKHWRFKMSTS